MTELEEIEQRFWSKVWQCAHRHPCQRCCWPWRKVDLSVNWRYVWDYHGTFAVPTPAGSQSIPAARFAYETQHGTIAMGTKQFHLAHLCYFGPCCNPPHLALGTASDNSRDTRIARQSPRSIRLPDGQWWSYADACAAQKAFWEAVFYQRVFAGKVHPHFHQDLKYLDQPFDGFWPGKKPLNKRKEYAQGLACCEERRHHLPRSLL